MTGAAETGGHRGFEGKSQSNNGHFQYGQGIQTNEEVPATEMANETLRHLDCFFWSDIIYSVDSILVKTFSLFLLNLMTV